jgi:hypothetical protein
LYTSNLTCYSMTPHVTGKRDTIYCGIQETSTCLQFLEIHENRSRMEEALLWLFATESLRGMVPISPKSPPLFHAQQFQYKDLLVPVSLLLNYMT